MKQLANNYSITGSSVTLTGVNVPLSQILLVSDATTGNVLYSMAGPSASSYTQGNNSVITLATAPGANDKLTVYYDDGVSPVNAPASVSLAAAVSLASGQSVSLTGGTVTLSNPTTGTPTLGAAVSLASGQNVGISSLPSVTISNPTTGTPTLGAAVSLASGQNVGISSLPSVTISNPTTGTPTLGAAVSLASGQNVGISSLPSITGTVSLSGGSVTNSNLDVALSTRLKASDTLAAITSVGSITNAVTIQGGNATAVKTDGSAVVQPVSLASVPSHAVTNAGTFAVQPTNGSNSLSIDSLGAATVNTPSVQTFSTSSTLASGNAINWGSGTSINCSQFRSVAVHFATGSGVVTGQVSNDNTNWLPVQLWNLGASIVTNGQLGAGNVGIYPTEGFLYFRLLVSTSLTGSVSIIATPSQTAPAFPAVAVSGTVAVSNGSISLTPSSTPTSAAPATFTSISSAQILAANSSRKGIILSSPSTNTGICYVVIGTASASTSSFSFPVNPGDILSLTGIGNALTGIWTASSNTLYVTELT